MNYRYLCSMGANIAPEANFAAARELLSQFGHAYYSRAVYTQPVAMTTNHQFLNALFIFVTDLDPVSLKEQFNTIEQRLGRDRDDPLSAQKDRPMDIDILGDCCSSEAWQQVPSYLQCVVPNLRPIVEQLSH